MSPMDRPVGQASGGSALSRLAGMFFAPRETLAGLAASPSLALVLTATALAGAVQGFAVSRATDFEAAVEYAVEAATREAERFGAGDEAASEAARRGVRDSLRITRGFAPVLGALGAVIAPLVAAAWFLLAFGILGVKGSYRLLLSTVAHAGWPAISLGAVLTAVVAWLSYPVSPDRADGLLRTSLASWAPGVEGAAAALLGRLDVLLAWEVALTAIGFGLLLEVRRSRALVVTLSLWVVVTLIALAAAILISSSSFSVTAGPP